jgi:PAS domain-containing protein
MDMTPPSDAPPLDSWHPKVRKFFEYWHHIKPAPDQLPGRQHFDPLHIVPLMPLVWLVDVVSGRLRYRMLGTRMVDAMQRDVTGWWLDEAHPAFLDHPLTHYFEERWRRGEPTWRRGRPFIHVDPEVYEIEQAVLPLAKDGRNTDMLLCITVFFRADGEEAFP